MSTGAVVARILTQYSDKGSKQAQKDIQKLGKKIDAFGAKAAKSFGLAAAATAALAVKIGKDAVNAAIEDQRAQALLANTLARTTGATTVQIAAVEKHIDSLEMLSTVSDTELRQSFADIVAVTGNVTSAMQVQTVALDVAKGRTLDLSTVSNAFTKAIAGNFTALKKVLPGIDANIIKNKDMAKAMAYATSIYGGSAEAFGDTEPLKRLSIAYGRVLETLGGALLPVVKEFTTYLVERVLPSINKWVEANKTQLADSLRNAAKLAADFLKVAGKVALWATNNLGAVKAIAAAIATVFVVNKLSTFITSITTMISMLGKLKTQADLTNASTSKVGLLGKAGVAAVVASVGIPLAGELYTAAVNQANNIKDLEKLEKQRFNAEIARDPVTLFIVKRRIENLKKEIALVKKLTEEQAKFVGKGTIPYAIGMYTPEQYKVAKAEIDKLAAIEAAAAAASLRQTQKTIAAELKKEAVLKRLKKLSAVPGKGKAQTGGVTPVSSLDAAEYEAINFRAAELLLIKQKDNQAEIEKLKNLKENILLQGIRNTLSQRYKDILVALADSKIDDKDIASLAGIWGVTKEAAKAYIETVFAISDGTISDDEVTNLAKSWGSTKAQAEKYLQFFAALNDGILSDAEIEKLRSKWGLTEAQVRQYADFVGAVSDGKLNDSEIQKLMDKWKLSTDQVVAYLYELGAPVTYNGNLIEPGRLAELAWKNATAALEAYLRLLGQGSTSNNGSIYDPNASADANKEAADAAAAAADAAKSAAEANSAATDAAIAAANKISALVTTLEIKKASGRTYLTDAEMDQVLTASNSPYAPTATASSFVDERSKFQQKYGLSSTIANASTIGTSSSNSGTVVNLTVNGSVSTEQDLVQTIRTGLLAAQQNGQGLTLQAI